MRDPNPWLDEETPALLDNVLVVLFAVPALILAIAVALFFWSIA